MELTEALRLQYQINDYQNIGLNFSLLSGEKQLAEVSENDEIEDLQMGL